MNLKISLAILSLLLLSALGLFFYKNPRTESPKETQITSSELKKPLTQNPPLPNGLYTNEAFNYQVTIPEKYELLSEISSVSMFGVYTPPASHARAFPYLTITASARTAPDFLEKCETLNTKDYAYDIATEPRYCLSSGKLWGKPSDIEYISLDGVKAESFYISGGSDNDFHIVRTIEPSLQLKMYVSGGGLDQEFAEIIKSFKFL